MFRRAGACLLVVFLGFPMSHSLGAGGDEPTVTGGVFLGGSGIFNLDRDTSDPALELGGFADLRVGEGWALTGSAGFLTNVGTKDAFDNRSGQFSTGLRRYFARQGRLLPFANAGYAYVNGEDDTHHFAFVGAGVRHWYGETIGWQLEVRDYVKGGVNHLQVRLSVLLR
jgi:hypothetical protein